MGAFHFLDGDPVYNSAEVFYVRIDPEISSSDELLRAFYYSLWLPGYFGFNWDALYDCLRDLEWIPQRKVVLVHRGLPKIPQGELKIYLEVLRDAALSWEGENAHDIEVFFDASDQSTVEENLFGC
ncbi:barstar family protein [Stenotrophomonas ginsengisoli]|uniref:barstar family protein n=1 Tax=Stenotrophomonas ginsengisoli TaxID=336566 RepID=UPI0009F9F941|nr:barstar family protein [Stenotrophomonas ginsengisoli]